MIDGIPDIVEEIGIMGIFLRLFNREIDYWVTAIAAYYKRPYDVDRNPKTHDWCKLFNSGNGEWEIVSLTFRLAPRKEGNGVFVHYYISEDNHWILSHIQRVPFLEWKAKDKARLSLSQIKDLPNEHKNIARFD